MPTVLDALKGIANICEPVPHVVTGGQPTLAHLEALKTAGGGVVLDIRDPMESRPLDEPAAVESLGMEYVNVPISPGTTSDEKMERILAVLRENRNRTVFFHCGSGNRVGGPMIAHLMLDHGMPEEQAVETAMRIGLRSPEYLHWGLDYVQRNKR